MNSFAIVKSVLKCATLISVMLFSSISSAYDECTPFSAIYHLEGTSPYGPFNGGAVYNVGDQPPAVAQLGAVLKGSASFDLTSTVATTRLSSMALFAPGADGSINVLTGVDRVKATATGPGTFEAITRTRITGGVGVYENVTGRSKSTSTTSVDLTTGYTIIDISGNGVLCGIGESGDD